MEITILRFEDLLEEAANGKDHDAGLAPGQMLLLAFNGLFEKIESSLLNVMGQLKDCQSNGILENFMDSLKESWSWDSYVFDKLQDALLSKRVMLMLSLFQTCSRWTESFQAGTEWPHDVFTNQFHNMAADWIGQFLTGFTSFSIGHVIRSLDQDPDIISNLDDRDVPDCEKKFAEQSLQLVAAVGEKWKICELGKMSLQRRDMDQLLVQVLQQQITAHTWIHDTSAGINSPCGSFIIEIRQALSYLLSQSPQLSELHSQVATLTAQVEQRLKWAAGSNPSLQQVMREFKVVQDQCLQHMQQYSSLATSLGGVSSAVVHYEAFRTRSSESLSLESSFIQVRISFLFLYFKFICPTKFVVFLYSYSLVVKTYAS